MSIAAISGGKGSLHWFAAHEARLFWRDIVMMWTAGRPHRAVIGGTVLLLLVSGLHWLVAFLLRPVVENGIAFDTTTVLAISGALIMLVSLMFSQALESVTRAYYARQDLDLILSSPVPARRLFIVRSLVLTAQTILLSLLISAPVINVLAWRAGPHWLAAYPTIMALGAICAALAFAVTLVLFNIAGPKRTRSIAQILSAVVGAGFVIILQGLGIMLGQGLSRFAIFLSSDTVAAMPDAGHSVWLVARAAGGDPVALSVLVCLSAAALAVAISVSTKRFADDVMLTAGLEHSSTLQRAFVGFKPFSSVRAHLRRKEWRLFWRDPWLMSQSLQQILYLIPPALLLWFKIGENGGVLLVAVPVLVMAVGQLAGGLAWITICGEDAHDLVATAPVRPIVLLRAKIEAVFAVIAVLLLPFVAVVSVWSLRAAICLMAGAFCSASFAVLIQLWFRSQANRSLFRRRQVSSRVATISEALVSILCAAGAGLAILHVGMIIIPAIPIAAVLGLAYVMRPRREG